MGKTPLYQTDENNEVQTFDPEERTLWGRVKRAFAGPETVEDPYFAKAKAAEAERRKREDADMAKLSTLPANPPRRKLNPNAPKYDTKTD